jgi:hypothetical protein
MSGDLETALLIDALVRDTDPLTRFISSLPDDAPHRARCFAEETVRLRDEMLRKVQCMLTATDVREAAGYAEWVRANAHEVAYRWASLRVAVQRWAALEPLPAIVVRRAP